MLKLLLNKTAFRHRERACPAWRSSLRQGSDWQAGHKSNIKLSWCSPLFKTGLPRLRLAMTGFVMAVAAHTAQAKGTTEEQLKLREREIEVLAKDFESTMISRTLKSMYEGMKTDPIAGGGKTEEIYREMLLEEYAKVISKGKGFGLAKCISRDIKRGDTQYQKLMRVQNEQRPKPTSEQ